MLEKLRAKIHTRSERAGHRKSLQILAPAILSSIALAAPASASHLTSGLKVTNKNYIAVAQAFIDHLHTIQPIPGGSPKVESFTDKECSENKPTFEGSVYYNKDGTLKRVQAYPLVFPRNTTTLEDDLNYICLNPLMPSLSKNTLGYNPTQYFLFKMAHEYGHMTVKRIDGSFPAGAQAEKEADTYGRKALKTIDLKSVQYPTTIKEAGRFNTTLNTTPLNTAPEQDVQPTQTENPQIEEVVTTTVQPSTTLFQESMY